jgi:CRP-like cAMP-binding protein
VLSSSDENETHDVKLIDFGAAVALEEGEQVVSGGRVGTWTYWAPEQADKDRPYDSAVDMWSLGVLLYIMLTGRHPFERAGIDSEEVLERILNAEYSLAGPEWRGVSPRAAELVAQLMHPDPKQRLSAVELLNHSWVRGEGVPDKPLPDTLERLRAFKKASAAIHGSLLLAALLHQERLRESAAEAAAAAAAESAAHAAATKGGAPTHGGGSRLQRTISISEGVGMPAASRFDVARAAWRIFDPENKGHISADDLRRVCREIGLELGERDVDNMLAVLAPSASGAQGQSASSSKGAPPPPSERNITFDKFETMMQSSYRRRYHKGDSVFEQGDEVRGFYILIEGEVAVKARGGPGAAQKEVTRLGPGDFFGETGLFEGREARNTSVECVTEVELVEIDKDMFLKLAEAPPGTHAGALSGRMRRRAEARQRRRLKRAIEMVEASLTHVSHTSLTRKSHSYVSHKPHKPHKTESFPSHRILHRILCATPHSLSRTPFFEPHPILPIGIRATRRCLCDATDRAAAAHGGAPRRRRLRAGRPRLLLLHCHFGRARLDILHDER